MKFDTPAEPNVLDNERVVTRPYPRIDGPLKVTGQATYSYEFSAHEDSLKNAAYGYMRLTDISKGKILSIDTRTAAAAPGVLLVLTHENMPRQGGEMPVPHLREATPQLQGAEIFHAGQAVAYIVAETFEQARAAARLVQVEYEETAGRYSLAKHLKDAKPTKSSKDSVVGDFEAAFKAAPVKVDVTYTTPDQSQNPMEPHATTAVWDGENLTLYTTQQVVHWAQRGIAETLDIPQKNLRIVARYIGGGFGAKLMFHGDAILSAVAARELGRPVKTAIARPQMYNHTSHRPATIQHLRLGADKNGRLVAVGHDSYSGDLAGGTTEIAADQTKLLYAGANRLIRTRLAELDLPPGGSMRAPGEAVGMLALECALDELAEKLDIDPVELRIINDIQYDPEKGPSRPYSSRSLVRALRVGAEKFGWDKRHKRPGEVYEGDWLIGLGVSSAFRGNLVMPSGATMTLQPGGTLTLETQMTDIGTGSYTILGQIAAEMLGVPLAEVEVKLGDSEFPQAAGSGGSFGANSAGSGVYYACEELRREIAKRVGFKPADTTFEDGYVCQGPERIPLSEVSKEAITVTGNVTFGDLTKEYVQASFGAHFAEVAVHAVTGEIRVRRMLSVAAAGRILNPVTARSQCLGGMAMGIGAALMEELVVDEKHGLFVNHDLAEYAIPVHADIPDLDVIFLDDLDDKSSPLKAKGVGELGICGVGAAVANAVYNASGVRIREYPLTLDKVLAGWAAGQK